MKNIPVPEPMLSAALCEAFGSHCRLANGSVLAGGTRKQVWRLDLEGAGPRQVVLLAWHNERDYFNERGDNVWVFLTSQYLKPTYN